MIRSALVLLLLLSACTSPPKKREGVKGMDAQAVRGVIRKHRPQLDACYEAALQKNPELDGKLLLRWEVSAAGSVMHTKVLQSLEPEADACIIKAVKGWKFPPPPRGEVGVIDYPFVVVGGEE